MLNNTLVPAAPAGVAYGPAAVELADRGIVITGPAAAARRLGAGVAPAAVLRREVQ